MFQPDFSEIQKNGFRINHFRLFHSSERVYEGEDLIKKRDNIIAHLIEQDGIYFTVYYFSVRLMYLFIILTLILVVSNNIVLALPIISALLSITFYILSYRHKVNFILGHIGITFAESVYNARINEEYNF